MAHHKAKVLAKFEWIPLGIFITVGAIISILGLAVGVVPAIDRATLDDRITSSIRGYTTKPEFFTTKNLIDKAEGSYGFDGDIRGTFQLTKEQAKTMLTSDTFIKCSTYEHCKIEKEEFKEPEFVSETYCNRAEVGPGNFIDICVNANSYQVDWSESWY